MNGDKKVIKKRTKPITLNSITYNKVIHQDEIEFISRMQVWFNIQRLLNVIYKSLAPGQNSMCDLSGLTKNNYKVLSDRPLRKSCPTNTHTTLSA